MAVKNIAKRASKPKKATKRVARRAKRVTKKSQTGSKLRVWYGSKMYTTGGLMKSDLCRNKKGSVVSKKLHQHGKKQIKGLRGWLKATAMARKQLKLKGFHPIKRGTEYYKLSKRLYAKMN